MFKFLKVFFTKKKVVKRENLEKECIICLDDIEDEDYITKCNHRFHKKCINEWISIYSNKECPICRKELGLYILETKRERNNRIKKEEHLEQIKREEEELERLARRRLRRQRRKERNKIQKEKFLEILYNLDIEINPNLNIDLNNINFSKCVSLKKFIKEHQIIENDKKLPKCYFCKKKCSGKVRVIRRRNKRKILHIECHKILMCHYRHVHC